MLLNCKNGSNSHNIIIRVTTMNKMRRALVMLMATVTLAGSAGSLVACSGGNKGNVSGIVTGNVNAVAYDGSKVTISFYHTMGAGLKDILESCIADFNALYPNITVLNTSYGKYPDLRDQISTEISSGYAPSLAYCYPDHVALYNKSAAVLDLNDYIASTETITRADGTSEQFGLTQEQIDDFIPIYYNEGRMYGDVNKDGTTDTLTLPMLKSTELLYYNKTYFDEHKDTISVPTTWDEMEAVCKQILAIEDAKEGGLDANPCVPLGYDSSANWFITMTEQLQSGYTSSEKGSYFLFNNDTNKEFVERFRGWYKAGYVTTEEVFGSYTSNLFTEITSSATKCYMCIGSSAGATYQMPKTVKVDGQDVYPFEVGVTMIPQTDENNKKMISQGPSLCLFKKTDAQEMAAAWLFAKFITTTIEYQARFAQNNGYAPVIKSVENDPIQQAFLADADGYGNLPATAIKLTQEFSDYYFISPAFNGSSTARDEMATLMENCFLQTPSGNQSVSEMIASYFDATYTKLKNKYDK